MTMTYVAQIFDNTPFLQAAGRTHRQYALNIASTALALRTEAALTPQYPLANNPFGKVVGRLYSLIPHKCPQIILVFKDITAFTAQLAVKARTNFQQRFNTLLKFGHSALKCFPLQCAVTCSLSQLQYRLCQTMKLLACLANRTFSFTDRLEIPFQMRPAYLADQFIKMVGVIAITYQLTRKTAHQFTSCLLAAVGMNHKNRRCGTTESPQPTFLLIAAPPAGFIGMGYILFSDMFGCFMIGLFQYIGQLCLAITQAAKTHRYREYLVHHRQRLTLAYVEPAGQDCYHSQYAGAEVLASDVIGQRSVNECSAIFASRNVLNIFNDMRQYFQYINNLMALWVFVGFFQVCAAASAYFWLEMKMFFYQLLRQKFSQMRLVALSCSAFFTPTFRRNDGYSGWIRRWRLGRILRIHPQKPFKFFDTLFQHCDMFFQCRIFRFQLLYIRVFVHEIIIGQKQRFTKI